MPVNNAAEIPEPDSRQRGNDDSLNISVHTTEVSDDLFLTHRPSEKPADTRTFKYWLATVFTFAARETKELLRDKIRLFFAAFGPVVMLSAIGWAVSFDVEGLNFAVLDRDQSAESRRLAEQFRGSPYFREQPPVYSLREAQNRMKQGDTPLIVDIPAGFGRALAQSRQPEIGLYIDGTEPFNAATVSGYAQSLVAQYNIQTLRARGISLPDTPELVPRLMYNQDFRSINAMTPNILVIVLIMIPAIMSALSVVRERETGSIANLYASPATVAQYLSGKQLPYVAMGVFNCAVLALMVVLWFGVPLKGSLAGLMVGATLFVGASTALGLLISAFTRSQTAAFFIASIGTMVPTITFSGLFYPLSSMTGGAYAMGVGFPASWFQKISIGSFAKGLGAADFGVEYAVLALFCAVYLTLACVFLKKQEK